MLRNVKILGTGKYVPRRIVTSAEIDQRLGLRAGWTERKSGVRQRYYCDGERASEMGAKAAIQAIAQAGITLDEIDAIICASGTVEQPIPCTASLIHRELKTKRNIPAFDVNSTCLSFVTGLDMASYMMGGGSYRNILIVSTEVASVGINPQQIESYVLFGDAAAACVIGKADLDEPCCIRASYMETYSEGAHLTEIRGGGTRIHPNDSDAVPEDFLFDMQGQEVFRLSSRKIDAFMQALFQQAGLSLTDVDWVIPHQASGMAMRIMRKRLGIPEEKMIQIIESYGNTIAASIPLALHEAIVSGRLCRGQKVLLIGTSAGLSIGGMLLAY